MIEAVIITQQLFLHNFQRTALRSFARLLFSLTAAMNKYISMIIEFRKTVDGSIGPSKLFFLYFL